MQTRSGKRMFRFVALFIAILTVVSAFSACDASGKEIPDEVKESAFYNYLKMQESHNIFSSYVESYNSSNVGVPDGIVELVVLDYLEEHGSGDSYSFTVVHNYDKESKIDRAEIELEIEYKYALEQTKIPIAYSYDRASDLWQIERKGNWAEASFQIKCEELIGSWQIEFYGDRYEINITDAQENSVSLEYAIACVDTDTNHVFYDRGDGRFQIIDQCIHIPIYMHDGFTCGGILEHDSTSTELHIYIDPRYGCYSGRLLACVYYNAP